MREKNKATFFDRDGTINEMIIRDGKVESPRSFSEFRLVKGIKDAMLATRCMGYYNIVVTNQPDVVRGKLKLSELYLMHNYIIENLLVDDILMCLHDDKDNCSCRKPKPGMLLDAAKKYNLDLSRSFMIGDSLKDMGAAKNAGCKGILIDAPYNKDVPCWKRVMDIKEAIDTIIDERSVA